MKMDTETRRVDYFEDGAGPEGDGCVSGIQVSILSVRALLIITAHLNIYRQVVTVTGQDTSSAHAI
jgi:hypothetical protein